MTSCWRSWVCHPPCSVQVLSCSSPLPPQLCCCLCCAGRQKDWCCPLRGCISAEVCRRTGWDLQEVSELVSVVCRSVDSWTLWPQKWRRSSLHDRLTSIVASLHRRRMVHFSKICPLSQPLCPHLHPQRTRMRRMMMKRRRRKTMRKCYCHCCCSLTFLQPVSSSYHRLSSSSSSSLCPSLPPVGEHPPFSCCFLHRPLYPLLPVCSGVRTSPYHRLSLSQSLLS